MTEQEDNWVKRKAEKMQSQGLLPDQEFEQLRERVLVDVANANNSIPKIFPGVVFQCVPDSAFPDTSFAVRRIRNGNLQDKHMLVVRFRKEPEKIMIEFENHQVHDRSLLEITVAPDPLSQRPTLYLDEAPYEITDLSQIALNTLFFPQ